MGEVKKQIPMSFYYYIQRKLWEQSQKKGGELPKHSATEYLGRWNIEKRMRPIIIKELELLDLIKLSRYKLIVLGPIKSDKFFAKLSERVGIF